MAINKLFTALVFVVLTISLKSVSSQRHELTFLDGKYVVGWIVSGDTITFDVAVETTGYIGLGVSAPGNMYEADIALGGVNSDSSIYLLDCIGQGPFRPMEDDSQDLKILYGYETSTHTYMRFSRLLNTGDVDQDVPIINATTNLIWSIGATDNIGYHGPNRGNHSVNLLNP